MRIGYFNRRRFLKTAGALGLSALLPRLSQAEVPTETPLHGLSAFGDLKYPAGFNHFDYASPNAPKGGTFNFSPGYWVLNQNTQTFNTLNSFGSKGDAPPRMELCFDSLMATALDEPDAIYGLIAESVTVSADRNSFLFRLRPEARFHDGSPITADDVAFTYRLLKEKGHPDFRLPLSDLADTRVEGGGLVRLVFTGDQSAQAILNISTMPILSRAWYSAREFDTSTLEPPLGSGAYRVGRLSAGNFIEYDRVEDYWARDLGVQRGLNHFDHIRIEFFRDRQPNFEAFKKGEIHWRGEFTSKTWATEYNFPAIQQGKVIKREFPRERRPTMQAWALNQRKERFRDPRVREAIAYCFDFPWTNKNIFYDGYEKSHSLFEGSDFKAEGLPSSEELALMEPFRDQLPPEIFGEPVMQPLSDGSGRDRKNLRHASELLKAAGFNLKNGRFVDGKGATLDVEFLIQAEVFTRSSNPFIENLRAIGINASLRLIDPAQYQARLQSFYFDMMGMALSFSATPTRESLELVFSSRSAETPGTRNFPGTSDAVLDALIAKAGEVASRDELRNVIRVLDRVLRQRRDWIPTWFLANHRVAYWDMFGFKEPKPDYGFPVETLWWFDKERARAIGKA
ncbi:MAG: extracellular solute-binding protein [Phyllobacterium sp.]